MRRMEPRKIETPPFRNQLKTDQQKFKTHFPMKKPWGFNNYQIDVVHIFIFQTLIEFQSGKYRLNWDCKKSSKKDFCDLCDQSFVRNLAFEPKSRKVWCFEVKWVLNKWPLCTNKHETESSVILRKAI